MKRVSVAAWVGGTGGLLLGLMDFGASWLWLSHFGDRAALFVRLLVTMATVGAVAGATVGALLWVSEEPRFRRRYQPVPLTIALVVPAFLVARDLFSGGTMRRLAMQPLLIGVCFVLMIALVYGGTAFAANGWRWLEARRSSRRIAVGVSVLLFAASYAATKVNQHAFPNLYRSLHDVLTVLSWALASASVFVIAEMFIPTLVRRLESRPIMITSGLLWASVFAINAITLDSNLNVRVAMLDARAPASQTAMRALSPVLAQLESTDHRAHAMTSARIARERRRANAGTMGLPTLPEAHVLLITIDALRADRLGAYGYGRGITPELDRFARQSVLFEHAYAAAPHSSYSLSSLMTSEYLHETLDLDQPLPSATLPRVLAQGGYHTAAFYTLGVFYTEGERLVQFRDDAFGFAFHDHVDDTADRTRVRVLAEVDRVVSQGEPPSFFWVHYFDVHEPYENESLGTSPSDRYDAEIRSTDAAFGRLLAEVSRRLHRRLIVLVSADHGEEFRDHGGVYHGSSLHEEQIRVPLLLRAEGFGPRHVSAPVELVDLAPTILGLLDLPVPATMRGDDLRPLALGRVTDLGPAFASVQHQRMVVVGRHKLIADFSIGSFRLFDLVADPLERQNLANTNRPLVASLTGEIEAWLDSLRVAPGTSVQASDLQVALARGRLGDRRAIEPLSTLIEDDTSPAPTRIEVARIFARGELDVPRVHQALTRAVDCPDRQVAAEAAIALGRLFDPRGRPLLRSLVHTEDPELRARAALALGRLRDSEAVTGLIECLWVLDDGPEREEAVRWLGRLRDPQAVEPLLALLPELRIRRLAVLALGHIGDRRAVEPLIELLEWETHSDVRDNAVRALGQLGDRRALERLVVLAAREPELKYTAESLVRLDALRDGSLGGADATTSAGQGLIQCSEAPLLQDWDYLNRTWCVIGPSGATLRLRLPRLNTQPSQTLVIVRLRRLDDGPPAPVSIQIGNLAPHQVTAEQQWTERRWSLSQSSEGHPLTVARIAPEPGVRIALDHVLLVPAPL